MSSFPVFKDIEKCVKDIFDDDFDTKLALKVKTSAPHGVTLTTNTTFDFEGKSFLTPKITGKWAHPSGFTLEKLEVDSKGGIATETSLVGLVDGLKVEFKGDNACKGDLGFVFNHPKATISGEVDACSFSSVNGGISTGHGAFSLGLFGKFCLKESKCGPCQATLGYTVPNLFKAFLKTNCSFSEHTALVSYVVNENLKVAAKADVCEKGHVGQVAGVWNCNKCSTTVKVKADTTGAIHASVKKALEKNFNVTGVVAVPATFDGFKFGINAVLG